MDLRSYFRRWMEYRRNLAELSEFDARELKDIGMTHADIYRVAREAFKADAVIAKRKTASAKAGKATRGAALFVNA
ncbi:DUF1127 domain-containing protein [Daeguia caeni]|uniref:DUF1127 domain-containing protein n=1 Tax=Daeguia caeni TaxID=439612 RepID=A0ABV9H8B5_9HYPH